LRTLFQALIGRRELSKFLRFRHYSNDFSLPNLLPQCFLLIPRSITNSTP
jgi:hypothetical protein